MLKQTLKYFLSNIHFNRLGNRFLPPYIVVLMYHDICEDNDFRSWLRVRKSDFLLQLKFFLRIGRFINIDELKSPEIWRGHEPKFLLTFDDGFVNNYNLVFPILKEWDIPALFSVSTSNVLSGKPFWFDWIVTPIQQNRVTSIDLREFGLGIYKFRNINDKKRWDDIETLLVDIKTLGNPSHPMVEKIIDYMMTSNLKSLEKINVSYRPMNVKEISEMHNSGLCRFGSHSHNHDILIYQNREKIKQNLTESISILRNILNTNIEFIAYPNGNYNQSVLELCSELGLMFGFSAQTGLLWKSQDLLTIPRIGVGGFDNLRDILFKINKTLYLKRTR